MVATETFCRSYIGCLGPRKVNPGVSSKAVDNVTRDDRHDGISKVFIAGDHARVGARCEKFQRDSRFSVLRFSRGKNAVQ